MEKAGCCGRTIKPRGGGRKRGVREGCRGGVKSHLFLDGCEFRLEWREWPGSTAQASGNKPANPGRETAAIRELYEGI